MFLAVFNIVALLFSIKNDSAAQACDASDADIAAMRTFLLCLMQAAMSKPLNIGMLHSNKLIEGRL